MSKSKDGFGDHTNRTDLLLDPLFGYATIPRPLYQHDCEKCQWLYTTTLWDGKETGLVDVYVHRKDNLLHSDVLLRYGSEPHEYYSYLVLDALYENEGARRLIVKQATIIYLTSLVSGQDPTVMFAGMSFRNKSKSELMLIEQMTEEDFPSYLEGTNEEINRLIEGKREE